MSNYNMRGDYSMNEVVKTNQINAFNFGDEQVRTAVDNKGNPGDIVSYKEGKYSLTGVFQDPMIYGVIVENPSISFVDKIIFGRLHYNKIVSEYKYHILSY